MTLSWPLKKLSKKEVGPPGPSGLTGSPMLLLHTKALPDASWRAEPGQAAPGSKVDFEEVAIGAL